MHACAWCVYVCVLQLAMQACSELFSKLCVGVREEVVPGSNGGAITAGSQLCRVESTTSKWL